MPSWEQTPRVLHVTGDPDITTAWRVYWPSVELSSHGYISDFTQFGNLNIYWEAFEKGRYSLISTPRMAFETEQSEENWYKILDRLHILGVKWVWETDDLLFGDSYLERTIEVNSRNQDRQTIEKSLRLQHESRLRVVQRADAITVATPYLAEQVQKLTSKPVYTIPNGINLELFQYRLKQSPRAIPPLTVGWSGGPRLERDLEPLYEVWSKLAELRPNVQFLVQGWCPEKMHSYLPHQRLMAIGGVEMEKHPAILKNFDVFCCVADTDPFNMSKSAVKWIDASLAGGACVVSKPVYGEYAREYVATDCDSWLNYLLELVDNSAERDLVRQRAQDAIVLRHTTRQTYPLWLEAWSHVVG